MRVRYLQTSFGRQRYYEAGQGPVVVLLHGLGAASDTWVRVIDGLAAAGLRVIAPDLPGHGLSDGAVEGDVLPQEWLLPHVRALLDTLSLDRVCLVGSAFGGLLAALLAIEDPVLVERLVLVGSGSVFSPPATQGAMIAAARANQGGALADPTPAAIRSRNVGSNADRGDAFEEIVLVQLSALSLPGRAATYAALTEGMKASAGRDDLQVQHRLEDIPCPVLVITGRDDPRVDADMVAAAMPRLRDGRLFVLDDCGHKPFSEQSRIFVRLVGDFMLNGRALVEETCLGSA